MRAILLSIVLGACAKQGAPVAATPDGGRPVRSMEGGERPLLLWEVRKGEAVSTLMGTCHMSISIDHALPEEHRGRLTEARVLVNEVDVSSMANPIESLPLIWHADYDLRETLGEQDFHNIAVSLRNVIPPPMLIHMRPWLAATSRVLKPGAKVPILDGVVEGLARRSQIDRHALETLEQQVAMMESFDHLFLTELRPLTAKEQKAREGTVDAMVRACLDADLSALDEAMSASSTSQMNPELLDARNRAWAEAVVDEANEGGMFMAVGAAHMIGETGMLTLLREHGFEITQLTTTTSAITPRSDLIMDNTLEELDLPDPARIQSFVEAWTAPGGTIEGLCGADQVIPQCFAPPEGATCSATLAADAALCASAFHDLLPAEPTTPLPPATAQQVFGCTLTGSIMSAVAEQRVPDTPTCQTLMTKMMEASAAAMGSSD